MRATSKIICAAALLAVHAAAPAMPVSTFLAKAEALQRKGALALLSSGVKLLRNRLVADALELRKERLAAEAAGRPTAFCPPAGGVRLTDQDAMAAMKAVPPAERARTDTKDALRSYLGKRFPCHR